MMRIGQITFKNRTVFAPLAGISNLPLRLLMKECGCGLVCSEMISAHGLFHGTAKTYEFLKSVEAEKPLSVQIFGSDSDIMAHAAQIVESSGADIIDINLGCSVKKILKSGSGSALLKDPAQVEQILKKVRQAIKIPLTIKIRSGWDASGDQALHIAKLAEDCGVNAITVHPRTATQGFGGHADWSLITRVKELVAIPVIGNGDIRSPEDALRMKTQTACDGIMIGRSAIGNPIIFSQVNSILKGERVPSAETCNRFDYMRRYLDSSVRFLGEERACYMLRSRLMWFAKGLPHSKVFRETIKTISS